MDTVLPYCGSFLDKWSDTESCRPKGNRTLLAMNPLWEMDTLQWIVADIFAHNYMAGKTQAPFLACRVIPAAECSTWSPSSPHFMYTEAGSLAEADSQLESNRPNTAWWGGNAPSFQRHAKIEPRYLLYYLQNWLGGYQTTVHVSLAYQPF